MASVPLAARVVEVIADLGSSAASRYRYGSGCIVGGRTVLTAAHVVVGAVSVSVRDPEKRVFPASADPRFTGDVNGPGPDLALLEIDAPGLDLPPVGLARVDRDSPIPKLVGDCSVIGYPAFMEQDTPDRGQVREVVDAKGYVPVLSRLVRGLLSVQVTVSPRALPPKETALQESEWSGVSGAPVLAGGLLLGVVSEHAPREGPSAITAVPLTALEADPAHPGWGPGVADPAAWWSRLAVSGISALAYLPPRGEGSERPGEFGLAGAGGARPVTEIPLPVSFEVRRRDCLRRVIEELTQPGDANVVEVTGMGGSGKSVLAAATARSHEVAAAFPGGRFWLELGPEPPLLQLQADLAAALGDSTPVTDIGQGRARLSRLLGERRCLLVLDNVWDQSHVSALAVAGPPCRVLITTREPAVPGAAVIRLGELGPQAALQLLAGWAALQPGHLPEEAAVVARECGYLPLALAVCGALVSARSHDWQQLLSALTEASLEALPVRLEDYPHPTLAAALGVSIDALPPDVRDRYAQLAVFAGQGPVPATTVQALWGLDGRHATDLIAILARKSLLRGEAGQISLHDLQMDYLTRLTPDLPALHRQLLTGYSEKYPGGWASSPDDGYYRQHLAYHLHSARRLQDLRALLLDPAWITARVTAGAVAGLLADYGYGTLPGDPAMQLLVGALRLSAHILVRDPAQLPGQLIGRLFGQAEPELRDLIERFSQWSAGPWLRPLTASLRLPGGSLERTLAGEDTMTATLALSADGRCAVTGGWDGMVRVWDVDSGTLLRILVGHDRRISSVAMSADGRRALSESPDGTVRVWNLDTGALVRTLPGHDDPMSTVALSSDGRRACTVRADGTVLLWDPDTGALIRTLTDNNGLIRTLADHNALPEVAFSADGGQLLTFGSGRALWDVDTGALVRRLPGNYGISSKETISGDLSRVVGHGSNGAVLVWDLETGGALYELEEEVSGWRSSPDAVAVSADGRRAVSSREYGLLKVWDIDSGTLLRTLGEPDNRLTAVALSADGHRAITCSVSGAVRVWDLDGSESLPPPTGHRFPVQAVAISVDGRRVISIADDSSRDRDDDRRKILVWDLGTGGLRYFPADLWVREVAMSADGRRAVTADVLSMQDVWDLDSGTVLHRLSERSGLDAATAVSADGRRAVSAGFDGTLHVWDLDSGTLLHTLTAAPLQKGKSTRVKWLAISADGSRAASCCNGAVQVWDLTSGKRVASFTRRLRSRHVLFAKTKGEAFAVSADGRRAVTEEQWGEVLVWNLETGAPMRLLRCSTADPEVTGDAAGEQFMRYTRRMNGSPYVMGIFSRTAQAISADGRTAVIAISNSDEVAHVWDLDSGQLLKRLPGHGGGVKSAAMNSDGSRVVSGDGDGTVRVWDVARGAVVASFTTGNPVTVLAATPSGTQLAVGNASGSVHHLQLRE